MNVIKIKYRTEEQPRLQVIEKGDWIDLYTTEDVSFKKGDWGLIDLGVAMELPLGYEAHVTGRSSSIKNFGTQVILGIIDHSYNGDGDFWKASLIAQRDTLVPKHSRIAQFRIVKSQMAEGIQLEEVAHLENADSRGGFGTTGTSELK